MKILHLETGQYPVEALTAMAEVADIKSFDCVEQNELYTELKKNSYEIIVTRLGIRIDRTCMDLQSRLLFIVSATTGLNHIDIEVARKKNIKIISLQGESEFLSSIKSTAEHTWALLMAMVRNLRSSSSELLKGKWVRTPFICDELNGKKLGIIGYGRLGQIVAGYGVAFGMDVLVNDTQKIATIKSDRIFIVELNKLLAESDYVMLMISWSKNNERFMNQDRFDLMKHGSYFVNTSRGELIDENALLQALKSGKLKGAALDVLQDDSSWDGDIQGSFPLINYFTTQSNLIITPHIGGYGKESIARTRMFVTNKLIKELNKKS